MHRKIKKLFKNPKSFWRDSRFNIKQKKIFKISNNNNNPILKPIGIDFKIDFLIQKLEQLNINGFYIEPLDRTLKYAICINQNDKKKFIISFMTLLASEDITLQYKMKNTIKKAYNINDFWSDIYTLKNVDIRLNTQRVTNKHFFWFRLEFWEEYENFYLSPTANHISRKLWKDVSNKHSIFCNKNQFINYNIILSHIHESMVSFDIDLVFTWVNSEDEDWKKIYANYVLVKEKSDATSTSRFFSRDELKYALRSWSEYGDFIRNIYIVSNCKPPRWLNLEQSGIYWIYHEEIMPKEVLPTFSSHAIETSLHKIEGLSNYFIYSNDDFLLIKPTTKDDFFFPNGIAKVRLEKYGNVNGLTKEGDPDYLNAARNSNKLLELEFKKTTTQLHTHSPQSMRIDILTQMEEKYADKFSETMKNKFRTYKDIAVTGYFYHHYAILSGNALQCDTRTELIQQNHDFQKKLKKLVLLKEGNKIKELPMSVCLNDGADSHLNETWNLEVISFLNTFFHNKSKYEI